MVPNPLWLTGTAKEDAVNAYRAKLAGIDCKHYEFGRSTCPFGSSCFYRHVDRHGNEAPEVRRFRQGADDIDAAAPMYSVKLSEFVSMREAAGGGGP